VLPARVVLVVQHFRGTVTMRSSISGCASALIVLLTYAGRAQGAVNQTALAANLEHFWSYGRSPPVYPSPQMSGSGGWEESYAYARQLVSQMTNDEKNNLTYGCVTPRDQVTSVDTRTGMPRPPMGAPATYQHWKDLVFLVCAYRTLGMAFEPPMA
jgi:hypothetical protein